MLMVGKYPLNNVNKKIIVIGKKKKKKKKKIKGKKNKNSKKFGGFFCKFNYNTGFTLF